MHKTYSRNLTAISAGILAFATSVIAAERTLPTPPPSEFADTESSVNISLSDWPDLGRRVKIDLTAYATPSNAVQIAFGQDTNGDEDLEPEETWLVLGVDCGEPFVRDEAGGESRWRWTVAVDVCPSGEATSSSLQQEEGDSAGHSTTTNCPLPTTIFSFKQPQPLSERITHAKVTTRGRGDTAVQIAAEIRKPGAVFILQ